MMTDVNWFATIEQLKSKKEWNNKNKSFDNLIKLFSSLCRIVSIDEVKKNRKQLN